MIVRWYKKKYLGVDESEMTILDGLVDGIVTVITLALLANLMIIL